MPTHQTVAKGFVKTENALLLMAATLAIGFVAGVVFSAYRSSSQITVDQNGVMPQAALNSQQVATLATLIKKTQDNPKDIQAWTLLGHFYFDAGDHANAITAYETSLNLDDTRPDVWTDLGVMYRRNGDPQKAIDCFDRAIALNPVHEVALFNKGIVLMHDIQDPQRAIESWKRLIQSNPDARTPSGILVKDMVSELEKTN